MLQSRRTFLRLIIKQFIMQNFELLYQQYKVFLTLKITAKGLTLLREFKKFMESLGNIDHTIPPKLKYSSTHLNFLLTTLSEPSRPEQVSFTFLVQVTNSALRASSNPKLMIPDSLIRALADRIKQNEQYQKSPSLISHVIWLVMRCISLSLDRQALVRRVSESKLLAECLMCPVLEDTAQKGVSMLLSYMSKIRILDEEFILKLIPHLHKFTQTQSIRSLLVLLRTIDLPSLKNEKLVLPELAKFLINYMTNSTIHWEEKVDNWKLLFNLAHLDKSAFYLGPLCIDPLLKTLIDEPSVDIEEELLNKVYEISCSLIKKTHQEQVYLSATAQHITSNSIARRIFIHHHEKITPQLFVDIIGGSLPQQLTERLFSGRDKDTSLKLLICLKRSSSLLGLDSFFNYKFKEATIYLREEQNLVEFAQELVDLWREVLTKTKQGNET